MTSSILGIVGSRSKSLRDFEIFLHLTQYKLSGPITKLWSKLPSLYFMNKHVCSSDTNVQNLRILSEGPARSDGSQASVHY